jgi:surface-anchored protein
MTTHSMALWNTPSCLLSLGATLVVLCSVGWSPRPVRAETLILAEGHVDLGVIYEGGQLSWRMNADGATSEGNGPGDLVGLYLPSELHVRVPDLVRIDNAPFPGNPNVTGVGSGPIWWMSSSGGAPSVPFLGWSWDLGLPTPPQISTAQWQSGRIHVELVSVDGPQGAHFSNWVGGTNYLSTFSPNLTNAPNVPAGSNSFVLPGHNHFNWGFTKAGVYDVTVRASGTHLTDGFRSAEATFRFLVGDATQPTEPAEVLTAFVYHNSWQGQGDAIDQEKLLVLEGLGPRQLGLGNLTNNAQGLNGLVFDIMNLADPSQISAADFEFQWSPQGAFNPLDHPPGLWQPAPHPTLIEVSGTGPHRIRLQWPNGTLANRWIRATLKSTPATGLAGARAYFIGHLLGETTGPSDGSFTVAFADISAIRVGVGQSVNASSALDIDKNGTVAFGDISAMRSNVGAQLPVITVP